MGRILVVDDVETDRELAGRVVRQAGHEPIYASDGAEAFEKAKINLPLLVLLDVVMPKQDGFKTARDLKKDPLTAKIPVVLVTSKNTESDLFWGRKQGADDHIAKPFSPEALLEVIRRFAPAGR
jgi:twitching motility two-component system response regulator PilH